MDVLLKIDDFNIFKTNNLILGASKKLKRELNKQFNNINASILTDEFVFSTNLVKTELENYNVKHNSFKFLNTILDKKIKELSIDESYYLKLVLKMPAHDGVYVIDGFLTYLSNDLKNDIFEYVDNHNIKIIYYSQSIEDNFFMDGYITIYYNDQIAISGLGKTVLMEDKIIRRLGYKLPFAIDLSIQLKLYNMVNKVCYSIDELVGELWK